MIFKTVIGVKTLRAVFFLIALVDTEFVDGAFSSINLLLFFGECLLHEKATIRSWATHVPNRWQTLAGVGGRSG